MMSTMSTLWPYLEGTSVWGNQGQLGKVRKIARRIARHQAISSDSGVGADEKIRQRRSLCSAPPAMGQERLAREEGGFVRNCFPVEHGFRKRGIELLDPRIPYRNLGINDRIDDEAIAVGGPLDGFRRPRKPTRIFRHDIEKNVGVNQYGHHSIVARQRHDGIGAHRDVATAPQMGD
jgi:hypothetical protein